MIQSDEELLSDWLLRLEELAGRHKGKDYDSLLAEEPCLHQELAAHPHLLPTLRRQFAALSVINRYVNVEANGSQQRELEIPGYVIEGQLGCGGMGIVYQARQVALRRTVAIKMLIAGRYASKRLIERFRREATIVAGLQHANIVQVYEVGDADGVPFIAIEWVSGGNLARRIGGKPQPEKATAKLIETLALAVAHAHEQGIVHRDLKPTNVLLTSDGVPKIADFGLAKLLAEQTDLTRTGEAPGTPSYMAPEQSRGAIHPQLDIYALGAILYEMVTGRPPFLAATATETLSLAQVQEPVAPTRIRPNLSRDLEAICLKCLEKDPQQRYDTARELAEDLQRFLEGQQTIARPLSSFQRTRRWVKRRPAVSALIAVSCLAVVTIAAGSLLHSWKLANALELSEQRRLEAVSMRAEADNQRQRVAEERDVNERFLYASRMRLANQLIAQGAAADATRLLDLYQDGQPLAGLRSFEWYWLQRRLHGERLTLRGHRGEVYGVAYAPNGKTLASGGEDGRIILWDPNSGDKLRTIEAHDSCTNQLAFSPDGRWLASCSCDKTVKLWKTADWSLDRTLSDHSSEVMTLAFSPDGKQLVSGAERRASVRLGGARRPINPASAAGSCERGRGGLQSKWQTHGRRHGDSGHVHFRYEHLASSQEIARHGCPGVYAGFPPSDPGRSRRWCSFVWRGIRAADFVVDRSRGSNRTHSRLAGWPLARHFGGRWCCCRMGHGHDQRRTSRVYNRRKGGCRHATHGRAYRARPGRRLLSGFQRAGYGQL